MWDGALAPKFTKSIGTVRYVPVCEMTDEDWEILEFGNLRTVAKNRIASLIVAGALVGFFHVALTPGKWSETGRSKPNYYWPATAVMVAAFAEDETNHDFFVNSKDQDIDNADSQDVEYLTMVLDRIDVVFFAGLVDKIAAAAETDEQKAEVVCLRDMLDGIGAVSEANFKLLIVIILLRYYTVDEVDEMLTELSVDSLVA